MFLTRAERRRARRRRRLFLFLAAVIALAAITAALGHTRAQPGDRNHSPHRPGSPAAHAAARTPSRPGAARPQGAATSTGIGWADFHGIQLPVSRQAGPRHTRGGLAWGFADTREGALLAAVNIAVRTAAQWGPGIYQPTIRGQVTGPDAAALLTADASDYAAMRAAASVGPGQPAGRGFAAEAGYRFLAYAPSEATVDIVTEGPGSGGTTVMVATRVQAVWLRGDWRVVAPPGGNWANAATVISSLTGYTAFPNEG